jgi:glycosyltransferase involved in cell wall biosynthesis
VKVVITHDYLVEYGGAERLVEMLLKIFPGAAVVTLYYDRKVFPKNWNKYHIKPLFPVLPFSKKYPQFWGILYALTLLNYDLSEYDLIISSDQIFAKMVRVLPGQKHICYQHSPSNVLYEYLPKIRKNFWHKLFAFATCLQKDFLRLVEAYSVENIDRLLTNSANCAQRIAKYWGVAAEVVFSGVEIPERILTGEKEEFFLVVARIEPAKRIEIAIEACLRQKVALKVVGDGSALMDLKKNSGAMVEFLGRVNDEERDELYQRAKALIVVAEEDLGLTPIEAMSCGTPVIAYGRGGVSETVVENVTGVFFSEQNVESLSEAIVRFQKIKFDSEVCREHARKFSFNKFEKRWRSIVDEVITEV